MDVVWWFVAVVVMAIGLLGTVLPAVPGAIIIFAAAVGHRWLVGSDNGMSGWGLALLAFLAALSFVLDFAASWVGAKYFGATRWGAIGATLGVIVGIFTGFVTLLVAPIVGAIAGEILGGQRMVKAGKAGWGTLLGNLAGVIGKLAIGLAMVVLFLMNARAPGL